MIKPVKFTDEELIASLMGDGDPDLGVLIAGEISQDSELAARLAALESLCGQLRQLPVEIFYRQNRPASALSLLVKTVALAGIFFTGVLAQSEFSIMQRYLNAPEPDQSTVSGDFPFSTRIVM